MVKLIKDKRFINIALILLFTSMALNFPFPHEYPYGETVATALHIPVQTDGIHYVGIAIFLFLFAGLYLLVKSLNKYHGRFVLIAIIPAFSIPHVAASAFQKTLARGIYAISYESESSSCSFEMKDETTLYGICELPFENYSNHEVQFTFDFYEKEDDLSMLSLMNNHVPYEVNVKGNEREIVKIEKKIDVSHMKNFVGEGESAFMNIIVMSGEKSRKL
ncbi:hypothetical protein LAV79_18620 [Peribacillus butanolivorans]|uniref:hypothetical protein n=1 Tax=Peribacillus butanolivorans TaxID=421767 RepID=UPI0030C90836